MNRSKVEDDADPYFHHHHHHHHHHILPPPPPPPPPFLLPSSPSSSSSSPPNPDPNPDPNPNPNPNPHPEINPRAHISTQFYTFNPASHSLMISCISSNRLATPSEIKAVTPSEVLKSWRCVWKDRNEDTAYLTAWKRIQDKLTVNGDRLLCFKTNCTQFVPHLEQWHPIVVSSHCHPDLKLHLGIRETIDRIKQFWTVGAKFYGIPESFIRLCVASCRVCSGELRSGDELSHRPKRRRFQYTDSFDVPAKDVPNRLQMLAKKHKVVLCIRQKYIRYKPFMAEVKDYACHRAGEPGPSKKGPAPAAGRVVKREPYASKRCGCGFRIRAIVPIANYNDKDKSFVYQEEGVAVFKLYAVHSGHEPGPLDGNARIMHRVVGHKGVFLSDQEEYGVNEDEIESDSFGAHDGDFRQSVLQQVQELKSAVGMLESRIPKLSLDVLESVSQSLCDIVSRVRTLGDETVKSDLLHCGGGGGEKPLSDDMLVGDGDLPHWSDPHDDRLYVDGKDTDLIDEEDDSFSRSLHDVVVPWDSMRTHCRSAKDLISESCKADKWLNSSEFDEKSILNCDESKLTKPLRHDDSLDVDVGLVNLQVDSFYQENPKWYDSPCGLDPGTDCGDSEFQHGEIV
ncbi:hypothetical protein vseg_009269 [Gypsophila vaccaria]